ncbi:MAG: thiol reductant ABC exporter subunit CydD [Microthrixaceae bacterium]
MAGEPRAADLLRGNRSAALRSAIGAVAAAVSWIAWLAWLWMLALVINRAFLGSESLADLLPTMSVMAGLLVLRAGATIAAGTLAEAASKHLRTDLRASLADRLLAGDPRRLGEATVGQVSGTLTESVEGVGAWVSQYLPSAAMAAIGPLAAFIAILVLDAPTTLILLFAGPMLVLLLAVIGRQTADLTKRRFDELGWLRGFYLDMLRGIGTLKAFGRSRDGTDLIEDSSRRFGDTTLEVLRTAFQTSLVMEWAATAATALVAVEVSFRLIRGDLTFGTALAVLVITPEFFAPLRRLSLEYHVGRTGDAAAADIAEVFADHSPAKRGNEPKREDVDLRPVSLATAPRIEFESVSYRYPGAPADALEDICLTIDAGETLALTGPSGAGKSTLASTLLRFIEPSAGVVRADGVPLSDLDTMRWRLAVAWVPQSPTLFAATVGENIALGSPDASAQRIRTAAADAGAADFIEDLPQGYDTALGESGLRLSGGQRQRLAIARALLVDAPLVVFDEFTAHLDPVVEMGVLDAAATLLEGRTALVIAHRSSTQRLADRVVRLDGGRMDETPTLEAP